MYDSNWACILKEDKVDLREFFKLITILVERKVDGYLIRRYFVVGKNSKWILKRKFIDVQGTV